MLIRLSSSLPSATASLARSAATAAWKRPTCVRFNSTDAALAPEQASEPKRRGVPLADNLGGVSLTQKRGNFNRQQRTDSREGNDGQQQPQRQNSAPRQSSRTNAGPRRDQRGDRDRNQKRPPRAQANATQALAETEQSNVRTEEDVQGTPTPRVPQIELGNLDELFGPPSAPSQSAAKTTAAPSANDASPSQARVRLLLERTAGDYSRYAPNLHPTTDVLQLGPVGLGNLVLSRKPDVGLRARGSVLEVVEKYSQSNGARPRA